MRRPNSSHPGWHLLGGLLVGGWVLSLAVIWQEHGSGLSGKKLEAELPASALFEEEAWFGIYLSDRRVGWTHTRLSPSALEIGLEQESRLQFEMSGLRHRFDSKFQAGLDGRGALRRFSLEIDGPALEIRAAGLWEAGQLRLEGSFGAESFSRLLPLEQAPLVDVLVPRLLAAEQLLCGQHYLVEAFDPQSLSNRAQQIEVVGPEAVKTPRGLKPAFRIRRRLAAQTLDTWFDEAGRVWREESSLGLVLQREQMDQATSIDGALQQRLPSWEEMKEIFGGGGGRKMP